MNKTKTSEGATPKEAPLKVILSWKSHPLKRSAGKSSIAVGAVALSIGFGGWYMESALFGALAGLVMFGSLAKFFLPTTYSFDARGVTVKSTTQTFTRPWNMFRSFYTDKNGVLLSPFIGPSRLENFRGLYLTFSDNREDVLEIVKKNVVPPEDIGSDDGDKVIQKGGDE
jgi:hypothetical protein